MPKLKCSVKDYQLTPIGSFAVHEAKAAAPLLQGHDQSTVCLNMRPATPVAWQKRQISEVFYHPVSLARFSGKKLSTLSPEATSSHQGNSAIHVEENQYIGGEHVEKTFATWKQSHERGNRMMEAKEAVRINLPRSIGRLSMLPI